MDKLKHEMSSQAQVPQWLTKYVTIEGVKRISSSVQSAEIKTVGEIVPMIVKNSAITSKFWHKMMPPRYRQKLVQIRAEMEFLRLKLDNTTERCGILIFVSLEDHEAVVLADIGIASKLPKETWREVIDLLLSGIKKRDMASGFCAAIEKCGGILAEHFPIKGAANPDQLKNHLIIKV